jgi:phospholipid transport system substrate-binding protein
MKRLLLAASLLIPFAASAAIPDSAVPVNALDDGLTAALKASASQNFAARYAALAPVIDKSFDLATILHKAIGLKWDTLPAAQQTALQTAFRAYTITTYVSNFVGSGTHFVLLPDQSAVGSDVIVKTQIVPASGDPVSINYLTHQAPDGWHIIDVLQNGTISQVAVTRSDFRSLLDPGDATRLIAHLNDKTKELSTPATQP